MIAIYQNAERLNIERAQRLDVNAGAIAVLKDMTRIARVRGYIRRRMIRQSVHNITRAAAIIAAR